MESPEEEEGSVAVLRSLAALMAEHPWRPFLVALVSVPGDRDLVLWSLPKPSMPC